MINQKSENQLNLALNLPNDVRQKTLDLDVGYSSEENTWELIVKYSGDLEQIREALNISITELLYGYAIVVIKENLIPQLLQYEQIEYVEKPKRLLFSIRNGLNVSCIRPVHNQPYNLTGKGVIVGIIDSGIDYSHPDFRNEDGTTRILYIWDQTQPGNPPEGYDIGTLYTREQINEALKASTLAERMQIVPTTDLSGHGTHVAGIAAGNGRASQGLNRGVAFESDLIIVRLGASIGQSFPKTTQLMQGLDFIIRTATNLTQPVSVNMSFGNNYGSHAGTSLIESYIDTISNVGRSSIAVGTGNEGASGRHTEGVVRNGEQQVIEFVVNEHEQALNLQLWKNFYDVMNISIRSPEGIEVASLTSILGVYTYVLGRTTVYVYYGEPSPYSVLQEVYMEFVAKDDTITPGIWTITLTGTKIVDGNYYMWLPTSEALNPETRFLSPSVETTLTIPSTASAVLTVGAYDSNTDSIAPFSGRGYTLLKQAKPDLVAPGVNITSAAPGGGYTSKSGTSMATPFVTGSAALLMEWGIVRGNDPYMYSEKVKAYLIASARELAPYSVYPNEAIGYGALCLADSFRLQE